MERFVTKNLSQNKKSEKQRTNKKKPVFSYSLIFLNNAENFPEGTEQVINSSYINIGRDSQCFICYNEEFPMVSRQHAAIEWSENNFVLLHLSATNQTLLNGRPINRNWFLNDGDIIQLAPSGPKLKFKLPEKIDDNNQNNSNKYYSWAIIGFAFLMILLIILIIVGTV